MNCSKSGTLLNITHRSILNRPYTMAAEAQATQLVFMAVLGHIGFPPSLQQEIVPYTGCTSIAMLGLMTPVDNQNVQVF